MSSLKKESIYFALSVFCALGAIISSMIAPNKLFGAAIGFGFAILCSIMIGIMFYLLNKRHIDEKHDAATAIGLSYERIETKLDSLLDSINNEYAISGELYRNFITKIAETTVSVAQHVSSVEDTICNLKDQQEKYHYKLLGQLSSQGKGLSIQLRDDSERLSTQIATVKKSNADQLDEITHILTSSSETLAQAITTGNDGVKAGIENASLLVTDTIESIEKKADSLLQETHSVSQQQSDIAEDIEKKMKLFVEMLKGSLSDTSLKVEQALGEFESSVGKITDSADKQIQSYNEILNRYASVTAQDARLIEEVFRTV